MEEELVYSSELFRGRKGNLVLAQQGRKVVIFTNVIYDDIVDKLKEGESSIFRAEYEVIKETDRVVFAELKHLKYSRVDRDEYDKEEYIDFKVGKYVIRKLVKFRIEEEVYKLVDILSGEVEVVEKNEYIVKVDGSSGDGMSIRLSWVLEGQYPELARLAREIEESDYDAVDCYNMVIAMEYGKQFDIGKEFKLSMILALARRLADELGIRVVKEDDHFIYFNDGTRWFKGDITCESYFDSRAENGEYIEDRLWLLLVADWILRKHIGEDKINKFIYD